MLLKNFRLSLSISLDILYGIVYNRDVRLIRTKGAEMNQAQLIGMRKLHESTICRKPPMSAKEMALVPHRLSKSGDMAILEDGSQYIWDGRFEQWTIWKV